MMESERVLLLWPSSISQAVPCWDRVMLCYNGSYDMIRQWSNGQIVMNVDYDNRMSALRARHFPSYLI